METVAFEQILQRPIEEWSFADLKAIADAQVPETVNLEFKADFEAGAEEPWRKRGDKISPRSRDALAAEIVAFANAYGGVLLLGISEKRHDDGQHLSDGLASKIPAIHKCAQSLNDALNGIIDPPIGMLSVKAIVENSGDEDGYLVIRVPPSNLAPHGVGKPARAYVRRGASSDPMTMRDLQHVFWEARTEIDRIEKRFSKQREDFHRWSTETADRNQGKHQSSVFYRVTLVPDRHYGVTRLHEQIGKEGFGIARTPSLSDKAAALSFNSLDWRPAAGGAKVKEHPNENFGGEIQVFNDGTVNRIGFVNRTGPHLPVWYAGAAVELAYNALRFRQTMGAVDIPMIAEFEYIAHRQVTFVPGERYFAFTTDITGTGSSQSTDRLEFGRSATFNDTASLFAAEIFAALGFSMELPVKVPDF